MADINSGPGWSATQWEMVNNAVTEAFEKASVAAALLPRYGPLPESAEYVRDEAIKDTGATVRVEDDTTRKLFNLTVKVELSSEQVAEDALSSALLAFRRAANTLAQIEDLFVFNGFNETEIVFRGYQRGADAVAKNTADTELTALDTHRNTAKTNMDKEAVGTPARVASSKRFHEAATRAQRGQKLKRAAAIVAAHPHDMKGLATSISAVSVAALKDQGEDVGEKLVTAVVNAIAALEDTSHPEPFASVLGSNVYEEAHRPRTDSMVLPADRITPLLKGPLLRSGQMDKDTGIVVSLAGNDIDIVVATPPKAQFLQLTAEAKYLFRVYEKFMLRIKDPTAVHALDLTK